ncbi:STM4012 family radical SAM protein [Herpetosiphon giganteus]|uniref:STM4012 family radical SAM protein n=1 Tax=Herpetosiphon giganteus TaxID=2029754 RepID=UPI00195AE0B2|nr:STM4012 family radical SAM protein [Herpetosiphon giganteus]MBM7844396.1 oxygen-independent coproporphyrinogen-3 oxidase [Herpetosiphon giganteus]
MHLREYANATPYMGYSYSYPHKSAYRQLAPRSLREVWASESHAQLFLYLHIPFCEMRCGFCNLFTTTNPQEVVVQRYLATLETQMQAVHNELGPLQFSRMAIGGGTPTYLDAAELEQLFSMSQRWLGVNSRAIPLSVETSPHTATADRMAILRQAGVDRVSIGVQSFLDHEANGAGRAQRRPEVEQALNTIRAAQIPTLNIDLIYGLPNQSVATWLESLEIALQWQPEELYLYPLYVRPLTGLDRRGTGWEQDVRLECYRVGRERLLAAGYQQISMRMFRAAHAPDDSQGPSYCCQTDGMLGLGAGARSYTRALHYSSDYAVGASSVRQIIQSYNQRSLFDLSQVDYGCEVSSAEQRRRFVIQSLLQVSGLDAQAYRTQFGSELLDDLGQINELLECGWAEYHNGSYQLTAAGLERSDLIGPWLYSPQIRQLSEEFILR